MIQKSRKLRGKKTIQRCIGGSLKERDLFLLFFIIHLPKEIFSLESKVKHEID